MSRIGKKLIRYPRASSTKVEGNTVGRPRAQGKVSALIAPGITLETKDGRTARQPRERQPGRDARG